MKRTHRDLGFTDEAFLELVDFYRELFRLDEKVILTRRNHRRLVRVLWLRTLQLKESKQQELRQQLHSLEKI